MKKSKNGRGPGQPPKNKQDTKSRSIRGIPDKVFRDFRVYCLQKGQTLGEALAGAMQKEIDAEKGRLELLVENIRGR